MASTGIGVGIGEALGTIGEDLRWRGQAKETNRSQQAHDLFTRGVHATDSLIKLGFGIGQDQQSGPYLYKLDTSERIQNPPDQVKGLFDAASTSLTQAKALYPPHESPALFQDFRKWFGGQPKPPTPDPRAAQFTPQTLMAEVPIPAQKNDVLDKINQYASAYMQNNPSATREQAQKFGWDKVVGEQTAKLTPRNVPFEGKDENGQPAMLQEFTDENGNVTVKPVPGMAPPQAAPTVPKVPVPRYVQGKLADITDPNTGQVYSESRIGSAPEQIQAMWADEKKREAAGKDEASKKLNKQDPNFEQEVALNAYAAKHNKKVEDLTAPERQQALLDFKQQAKMVDVQVDTALKKQLVKDTGMKYNAALDFQQRRKKMEEDAKIMASNPQSNAADIDLLANHIYLTYGIGKGSRGGRFLIEEALASNAVDERFKILLNNILKPGGKLTPGQRQDFINLAKNVEATGWSEFQANKDNATAEGLQLPYAAPKDAILNIGGGAGDSEELNDTEKQIIDLVNKARKGK